MTKSRAKYLAHYAEPEISLLNSFPQERQFQHVIVIPAFQESIAFVERFKVSALAKQNCLMIVVINQPDNLFGRENAHYQTELAKDIAALGCSIWQEDILELIDIESPNDDDVNSSILIVDRFSQPIPADFGVGLARKIGCDIAIALAASQHIKVPWVHSSDADAHLPENYLSSHLGINKVEQKNTKSCVATCCNFYHHSDDKQVHDANALYETALRYYVAGLAYANSPYAYFTIGSLVSFHVDAYCQVRGFPKRSAGEDFYLLNKLAKIGQVAHLSETVIKLDARPSERVPFGTGPAVKTIMALREQGLPYCYYHPDVFFELKACLANFNKLWQHRENYNAWSLQLSTLSRKALLEVGLDTFVEKHKEAKQVQFEKQLTVWFDSFKTLKFIHALRENGLDNMALQQALTKAPFKLMQ